MYHENEKVYKYYTLEHFLCCRQLLRHLKTTSLAASSSLAFLLWPNFRYSF
jgi:hypothetical protein